MEKNLEECITAKHQKPNEFILYKRRWIVLAVFSLISMSNEVIWISLSSITSIVKEYYGVSYIAVNWLSMIYMLFYIFVIISAFTLHRFGLKFTLVIGTVLNGMGSCLRLVGSGRNGFVFVFLGNASAALAQCFILFVPPTLAANWFGEKERATASSIGVLMNMLGVAVGFLMGGTLVPSSTNYDEVVRKGMFNTLISQALFCTILVIICVFLMKSAPPTPPTRSQWLVIASKEDRKRKINDKKNNDIKVKIQKPDEEDMKYTDVYSDTQNKVDSEVSSIKNIGFFKSLKIVLTSINFHFVTQAYGLYFGLFAAYNTVLNQMCTQAFPGKEKYIGLMGFTSVILGLFGILFAGIFIDKTSKYKFNSIITFLCCTLSLLIFTIVLQFSNNFTLVFVSFSIFGFFSYPYMVIGLEHAAELTYPISEGTTSGILLLVGNLYGIVMTFIFGAIIEKGYPNLAGYLMAACYGLGLIPVSVMKGELKRLKHDRLIINELLESNSKFID